MNSLARFVDRSVELTARVIGTASLSVFTLFLFLGPFGAIDLDLGDFGTLAFDGALCLGFCLQHSVMIRKSFRRKTAGLVPEHYYGAVYTVASGTVLAILVIFWQESPQVVASVQGGLRILTRFIYFLAFAGFFWGIRSLRSFDGFGLRPIRARRRGSEVKPEALTIRGPYHWVRHPMYFLVLVLIWSYPDITVDRIMFNVLMTVWIVVGTHLEERDLVDEFGDDYREYQQRVPMLAPWIGDLERVKNDDH
jgi:protein-S-isoprenylcysteine O-methyltransferase Ste14